MLGHFPVPYPDETLYSVLARLAERLTLPSERLLTRELFGQRYHRADLNLPHHLDRLCAQLPPEHEITPEKIINNHTLFPFYAPFLSDERRNGLKRWMHDSSMGRHGSMLQRIEQTDGITMAITHAPLRSCAKCRNEDLQMHGESYWHRAHQVPTLTRCPRHNVPLEEYCTGHISPVEYQSVETATFTTLKTTQNTRSAAMHLRYSRQSAALLAATPPPPFVATIQVFRDLLNEKGFSKSRGGHQNLNYEKILDLIRQKYGHVLALEFLINLEAATAARHLAWVLAFEQPTPRPPQVYFLIADAIDTELSQIFDAAAAAAATKPRIARRYVCRNRVSACFGYATIGGYVKSRNVGLFRCPRCGFAYCDAVEEIRVTRRFKISDPGPVWKERLRELWTRKSNSVAMIAAELGVGKPRVIVEAMRAGLPAFKRSGFSGRFGKSAQAQIGQREQRRKKHRRIWQDARRRYPNKNRTELTMLFPATRGWLDKNDHVWFRAHLPKPAKRVGRKSFDWAPYDGKAAGLVKAAARRTGQKICWTELIRQLTAAEAKIAQKCRRLPLTAAAFCKVVVAHPMRQNKLTTAALTNRLGQKMAVLTNRSGQKKLEFC